MSVHKPFSKLFVLNPSSPMTSGGSRDLGDGQVGLFRSKSGSRGAVAVPDTLTFKNEKYFLEVGTNVNNAEAGQTQKGLRSPMFSSKDVYDITYDEALESKVHKVRLGWDGLASNTDKGIKLNKGEMATVSIQLSGEPLSYYGIKGGVYEQSFSMFEDWAEACESDCEPVDCKTGTLKLVEDILNHQVRGASLAGNKVKLSHFIKVAPVISCWQDVVPTITATSYCLEICDNGDDAALGLVQAQYPGYTVKRTDYENNTSTYEILKTDGTGLPSAFTHWDANLKTNCAGACPSGYSLSAGGFLYSVSVEDDGADIGSSLFATGSGGVSTLTFSQIGNNLSDDTYNGVPMSATSGDGSGATFTITVSGGAGVVASVAVDNAGSGFEIGDTITIEGDAGTLDGTAGTDDITLVVVSTNATQAAEECGLSESSGSIKTGGFSFVSAGGSGITNGTYAAIPQSSTTGSGTGAKFNLVVTGNDVTGVTIVEHGTGHAVGDVITIDGDEGALDGNASGDKVTITITALNTQATTVSKIGQSSYGVGKYGIIFETELTDAEISCLTGVDDTLKIEYVGEVEDVCTPDSLSTTAWTACGTCGVGEWMAYIDLDDTDCGANRIAELEKEYPALAGTFIAASAATAGNVLLVSPTKATYTDDDRTADTYTSVTGTASGSGTGATFTIVVDDTGETYVTAITAAGSGYVTGETITIAKADIGSTGTDLVLTVEEAVSSDDYSDCRRRYWTTVQSNVVCEDCETEKFVFEEPKSFWTSMWTLVPQQGAEDTDCLCGLYAEGKNLKLCPPKELADKLGTVNGQITINISGGSHLASHQLGYKDHIKNEFAVNHIQRAFNGTGWGEDFWDEERRSYNENLAFPVGKSYEERYLKGTTPKLEPCQQYDSISVWVRREIPSGGWSQRLQENYRLKFIFPKGTGSTFKSFFNQVAAGNPDIGSI